MIEYTQYTEYTGILSIPFILMVYRVTQFVYLVAEFGVTVRGPTGEKNVRSDLECRFFDCFDVCVSDPMSPGTFPCHFQ